MLQYVAVCCSVLQCVAACCIDRDKVSVNAGLNHQVLNAADVFCPTRGTGRLHFNYFVCSVLQCVAVCCSVLQCVAVCYSVLQCAVTETR